MPKGGATMNYRETKALEDRKPENTAIEWAWVILLILFFVALWRVTALLPG